MFEDGRVGKGTSGWESDGMRKSIEVKRHMEYTEWPVAQLEIRPERRVGLCGTNLQCTCLS